MNRFGKRFAKQRQAGMPGNPEMLTMADLARRCGVSPATVSAALHGTGRVSPERREKIRRIAQEVGYRPQLGAQLLRAHRSGRLGFVMPGGDAGSASLSPGFGWPALHAFLGSCERAGMTGHIEFYSPQRSAGGLPEQLVGGLVDGCLVLGYIDAGLRDALTQQTRWPWVSIDEPAPHCVLAATDEGVYQGVQYLAALGHRRIAFSGGPSCYSMHRLGREGFDRAADEFALVSPPDWRRQDPPAAAGGSPARGANMDDHVAWAEWLLRLPARPTAIVSLGMGTASAILYAALKLGLDLPRDLSLLALGREGDGRVRYPAVSCIDLDFATMAQIGIALLQGLLRDNAMPPETRRVVPRLIPQASTGPAPRHS